MTPKPASTGGPAGGALRLAHLSDVHLPLTVPRGGELLSKRGLSALNWRLKRRALHGAEVAEALLSDLRAARPDAVAMTGDLCNFALAREFAAGGGWLDALGPAERVVAIPGNHEALTPGWRARMAQGWGRHALGPSGEETPFLRPVGPVALIAVSTAVATPPFMASGRVGPAARTRLGELIAQARRAGLLPVVLMHHPPTAITSRRKGLADREAVCAVLAEAGAALVLHGHTHRPDLSWIDGGGTDAPRIPVLGVPSFSLRPRATGEGNDHPAGAWREIVLERRSAERHGASDTGEVDAGKGRVPPAAPGAPGADAVARAGWTATITERRITIAGEVVARTPFRLHLPAQ
jgi:nucleotide-binding universal stress UspA family protein